ncbi:LPS export ABC transporter periplasmic protein LptC [Saccharicrinis aurantiacus]|uniref:LPS export ABC transporter periplasmic protein LptC n=1 Tax=Saccharicrinis aurantiacus TaxID=1849719 RepID=UPI000838AAFF|nr:LPS export ABC transporter periplasmic protein LptC [Saccharicrinis aurantiacus]
MKFSYSEHKNINQIIKTASSLVLLAVLFLAVACTSNNPEELKAIEDQTILPSLEVTDFETFVTDSGKVRYHIITPLLLNFDKKDDPYTEYPKGGQIITFKEDEVIDAQIKCKYAIHKDKDQLWDLRNNVEAVNQDGVVFNSEQLYWDEKEEKIYTDKFIKITTEDEVITGYGLTANQNMSEYEITKVSGILDIKE